MRDSLSKEITKLIYDSFGIGWNHNPKYSNQIHSNFKKVTEEIINILERNDGVLYGGEHDKRRNKD